jgi:membrane protein required for beta-lactamase induction
MHHRYVPIALQSILLFFTLLLGPVGFLAYYLLKLARNRSLPERRESEGRV